MENIVQVFLLLNFAFNKQKRQFYLDGCPCVGCEDCWECEHAPFQCKDPDQNKDFQKVIGNY